MRHQTLDSPGLIVPVNETDPILAKIITSNSPEDQLIREFLTNAEVEGGKAPAAPYDANLNTSVDLQDEDVQKLINKHSREPTPKKRKAGRNPYTDNMSRYEHIMKLVTSEEEQKVVNGYWNQMEESLYKGKKVHTHGNEKGGLMSTPDIETAPWKRNLAKR